MTKLIDADVLSHKLKTAIDIGKRCEMDTLELKAVLNYVEAMPTIDAEPVRHGKWIEHEWAEESEGLLIPNYECSECHTWERNESDYCPKCGARMDEE